MPKTQDPIDRPPIDVNKAQITGSEQRKIQDLGSSFEQKIRNFDFHKIVLRLQGSIDGCRDVGLTRLKLFDRDGHQIKVERHMIMTYASVLNHPEHLLLENPHTRKAEDMFLAEFPLLKNHLDLQVSYFGPPLALIRVWNYIADPGKGARSLEVIENGEVLASSHLRSAPLEANVAYHQDVVIDQTVRVPGYSVTEGRAPLQEEFDTIFDLLEQERAEDNSKIEKNGFKKKTNSENLVLHKENNKPKLVPIKPKPLEVLELPIQDQRLDLNLFESMDFELDDQKLSTISEESKGQQPETVTKDDHPTKEQPKAKNLSFRFINGSQLISSTSNFSDRNSKIS